MKFTVEVPLQRFEDDKFITSSRYIVYPSKVHLCSFMKGECYYVSGEGGKIIGDASTSILYL
jgi:hypothetical protein